MNPKCAVPVVLQFHFQLISERWTLFRLLRSGIFVYSRSGPNKQYPDLEGRATHATRPGGAGTI